ncbi:MAG: hypothetical protein CL949_05710 [Erythrobacter sp.]|nr:hypothetical protein [Erythrobacter sp.]
MAVHLCATLITLKPQHRGAILETKALGGLLRAVGGHEGQPTERMALKMLPHRFPWPGELRWPNGRTSISKWPSGRPGREDEMRRPHKVPLTQQVLDMLAELEPITCDGKLLFPSIRSADRPITDNTLDVALRRLGSGKTR